LHFQIPSNCYPRVIWIAHPAGVGVIPSVRVDIQPLLDLPIA
jgi:hypothetical protein